MELAQNDVACAEVESRRMGAEICSDRILCFFCECVFQDFLCAEETGLCEAVQGAL